MKTREEEVFFQEDWGKYRWISKETSKWFQRKSEEKTKQVFTYERAFAIIGIKKKSERRGHYGSQE